MTIHTANAGSDTTVDIFDGHTVADADHKLKAATTQREWSYARVETGTAVLTRTACRELHDDGPREFVNLQTVWIGAAR